MYKIVHGGNVIELATSLKFLRYLPKSKRTTNCDVSSANCVQVVDSKNIYAIRGKPLPDSIPYLEALIVQIPLDEYDKIKSILDSNKKVSGSTSALHFAKETKISELKAECNEEIRRGICIILSDGKAYQFELTIEDQLNLKSIENRLSTSQTVIYHEKGGVCRPFSVQDMKSIISAANRHIEYHTTYFNLMKYCIYNMYDVEQINSVHYGDELPDKDCRNTLCLI